MRVCGLDANRTLTGEQRRHPLGRQLVRLRQQVGIGGEHSVRVVTEAGGDDVDGDALRERERRWALSGQEARRSGRRPRYFSKFAPLNHVACDPGWASSNVMPFMTPSELNLPS